VTTIEVGYYVTIRDAGRVGFLMGPYATHAEALSRVEEASERTECVDPWAHFAEFGTTRIKAPLTLRRGGVTFGRV